MACSLNTCFYVSGPCNTTFNSRTKGSPHISSSLSTLQVKDVIAREIPGKTLDASDHNISINHWNAQVTMCGDNAHERWWEKAIKPNMIEINSAQHLVDTLLKAGDSMVIIDFYSPGCGGCKTLHPKICQLAESNPDAIFLKVNYEELKTMCHALHIPVLPFFRFYRGAQGKVCSFSCTNATIKKFKDALARHGNEQHSLGPAKGLDETELLALESIGQLSRKSSFDSPAKDRLELLVKNMS